MKLLSCEALPELPGKAVATVMVRYPPGVQSPKHRHPGSVTAYVLSGKVESQVGDGERRTYGVGETWYEPPGAVHAVSANASRTEPAELLAVLVVDAGCKTVSSPA